VLVILLENDGRRINARKAQGSRDVSRKPPLLSAKNHHLILRAPRGDVRFPIRGGGHGGHFVGSSPASWLQRTHRRGGPLTVLAVRGGPRARNEGSATTREGAVRVGSHQSPQSSPITCHPESSGMACNFIGLLMIAQCTGCRTVTRLCIWWAL
jgi:hypothetical protein